MKKTIISCLLATSVLTSVLNAQQPSKFEAAMGATLQQFGAAKTPEALANVAAKFERIAVAEKNQWLPYYYAANAKVSLSFMSKNEDKDNLADAATELLNKADSLSPNNSEIYCTKSSIATVKMLVNPMVRWQQYGKAVNENIAKAKVLDSTNPRPFMLQAINLKNTPENFGGGCKVAKPLYNKAMQLFEAFKPKSALHPNWGKEMLESVMKSCD